MMKSIISICFILFTFLPAQANDSTQLVYDSSAVEIRSFDENAINEHKEDATFDYGVKPSAELSLWERFKIWLNKILQSIFYFGTEKPIGKIIIYILLAAGLIYAAYKLSTIHSSKGFYGQRNAGLDFDLHQEDIHEMDFEKLINEAVAEKNYRLAIRLVYLFALKQLADKQLIDWQPGKTNHDYADELQASQLKPEFNELSYYFDYAWYGDFAVDQSLFEKVRSTFNQWKSKIN